jgi:hypothetical protein
MCVCVCVSVSVCLFGELLTKNVHRLTLMPLLPKQIHKYSALCKDTAMDDYHALLCAGTMPEECDGLSLREKRTDGIASVKGLGQAGEGESGTDRKRQEQRQQ